MRLRTIRGMWEVKEGRILGRKQCIEERVVEREGRTEKSSIETHVYRLHDQTEEQLRLVQSLSWGSEIAACEYLYMPMFPSKGKEAKQNWFLRVNPRRVETQQKKSRKRARESEKKEIKHRQKEQWEILWNKRKAKKWQTPSVKCKCVMFSNQTDAYTPFVLFSLSLPGAECSHYVIWFSLPSPSKRMASITHQLTWCLTVPSCKHHLTPAVFCTITPSGFVTLITGRYLILIRRKVKVRGRNRGNEDMQPSSQNIHSRFYIYQQFLLLHLGHTEWFHYSICLQLFKG